MDTKKRISEADVTISGIREKRIPYMRIARSYGKDEIVVRPKIGGKPYPQQRFKITEIKEAIRYINQCFEQSHKKFIGNTVLDKHRVATFGYYLNEYINYRKENYPKKKSTTLAYRRRLESLGRCNTDKDSVIDTRKIYIDAITKMNSNYLNSAKMMNYHQKKKTNHIDGYRQAYFKICKDVGITPKTNLNLGSDYNIEIKLLIAKQAEEKIKTYHVTTVKNTTITHIKHRDIAKILRDQIKASSSQEQIPRALKQFMKYLLKSHRYLFSEEGIDWDADLLISQFANKEKRDINCYSHEELMKLYNFGESSEFEKLPQLEKISYAAYVCLSQLGVRIGEELALYKVDFEKIKDKKIKINKTISEETKTIGGLEFRGFYLSEDTKTCQDRLVTVSNYAMKWLEFLYKEALKMPTNPFLIQDPNSNEWLSYGKFRPYIKKVMKKINIPYLPSHEGGRKTFANQYIDAAVDSGSDYMRALQTVQRELGHATFSTTEKSYARAKTLPPDEHFAIYEQFSPKVKP
jgi:site-specific recombinase XerD